MLKSKSTDTYSGTVSSQATRLLLGIIAEHDLDLRSFDVKTTFLYARLNEFSEGIYCITGSTPAEFIGAHTGAQAIMWARNFLEELGFRHYDMILLVSRFVWALSVSTSPHYQNDCRHTH